MNKNTIFLAVTAAVLATAALPVLADATHRTKAIALFKTDFQPRGQASLDRLDEDGVQAICNRSGNKPPENITKRLEADQMATVKYPSDGQLMGDWKVGEQLAQDGKGFTWTDNPGLPVGGNCYNCHQIGPQEIAYGTVGPSLFHFGKVRGNSAEMQQYVYNKIYNSKSYNLCTEMPRFGHIGALKPEQIKHLVALLLDPESPVNR